MTTPKKAEKGRVSTLAHRHPGSTSSTKPAGISAMRPRMEEGKTPWEQWFPLDFDVTIY